MHFSLVVFKCRFRRRGVMDPKHSTDHTGTVRHRKSSPRTHHAAEKSSTHSAERLVDIRPKTPKGTIVIIRNLGITQLDISAPIYVHLYTDFSLFYHMILCNDSWNLTPLLDISTHLYNIIMHSIPHRYRGRYPVYFRELSRGCSDLQLQPGCTHSW